MKKNNNGFTLAEVLITLGIIGIVAAMTIPTLINNYQKTQYVTQLKKAYTMSNQALTQITSDNGCIGDLKSTGYFDSGLGNIPFGDAFSKYFKVIKNCGTSSGCFTNKINLNYDGTATGTPPNYDGMGYYNFITADGMSFSINNLCNKCSTSASKLATNDMTQVCGYMYVDVNGLNNGPNFMGRDIFMFWITNGKGPKFYPAGGADDGWIGIWQNGCHQPSAYAVGSVCTGRVITEGWQMNY